MVPFDLEREGFMSKMFVCRILYFLGLISTFSIIEDWKYYIISVRGKNFKYKQIRLVMFWYSHRLLSKMLWTFNYLHKSKRKLNDKKCIKFA